MIGNVIYLLPPFKKAGLGHFHRSLILHNQYKLTDELCIFLPFKNKFLIDSHSQFGCVKHIIGAQSLFKFVNAKQQTTFVVDISNEITIRHISYYQEILKLAQCIGIRIVLIDSIEKEATFKFFNGWFSELIVPYIVTNENLEPHTQVFKKVVSGRDFVVLNNNAFQQYEYREENNSGSLKDKGYQIGIKLGGVPYEITFVLCILISRYFRNLMLNLTIFLATENTVENKIKITKIFEGQSNISLMFSNGRNNEVTKNIKFDYWFVGSGLTKYEVFESGHPFCVVMKDDQQCIMNKGFEKFSNSKVLKLYDNEMLPKVMQGIAQQITSPNLSARKATNIFNGAINLGKIIYE